MARDVVVALDAVDTSEDRRVRTPAIPQEFDDGNHDGEADARNRAQNRHAGEAADGQPEFPPLDAIDAA